MAIFVPRKQREVAEILDEELSDLANLIGKDRVLAIAARVVAIGMANRYDRDDLASAWWDGAQAQWKHRPIGNRIPETENPYRPVSDPQRRNGE